MRESASPRNPAPCLAMDLRGPRSARSETCSSLLGSSQQVPCTGTPALRLGTLMRHKPFIAGGRRHVDAQAPDDGL
ncbi:uncharacterized protein MYCGRDRAFT_103733 [Zymoseptoria tritici IPO323]|uniref:Uncharacterized protein n=1 Tax=Zymoseptoria tritici (strain CBS 115943 / IPO323) TaxID=336722 RepID=F9X542_ZYMTI|nr:uncharacterized protein MYCGRDRAFT_103733 [Zymoseptoria tritici IPO323]EGP88812.1 hypothetical protein MYCGRDRAFT_103733 [Zymoseptoria tritici IPO323]